MLTQLKNGNWVDLGRASWIRCYAHPNRPTGGRFYVCVDIERSGGVGHGVETVYLDTHSEAEAYRDELAGLANGTKVPGFDLSSPLSHGSYVSLATGKQFTWPPSGDRPTRESLPEHQSVTIPLEQVQAFTAMQARLAQLEGEQRSREQATQQDQARILAQKGEVENALRMLREQAEQQVQAERRRNAAIEEHGVLTGIGIGHGSPEAEATKPDLSGPLDLWGDSLEWFMSSFADSGPIFNADGTRRPAKMADPFAKDWSESPSDKEETWRDRAIKEPLL